MLTNTNGTAPKRNNDVPSPQPSSTPTDTPVVKATRSMLAKMDAQREDILRLRRAVQAALA
jgi:hypothetical protein